MNQPSMQFLYGDRELLLTVSDLLDAPVEVIVSPADSKLSHADPLAAVILARAGDGLRRDSEQMIREYGQIDSGMAVYTGAGSLLYKAIIHAVAPHWSEGDEQYGIEQAVSRSLQLCDLNEWRSIAFPAIGAGSFNVPIDTCAQAFFRTITHFWDARNDSTLEKVVVCLTEQQFRPFFDAFREEGIGGQETVVPKADVGERPVGHVELNEQDIADLDDDEIDDWFK
ncbi:MAG: macro domain-containing protein [Pseudomonadota bacterium]|nr:MAG: macro domain-containing protein [Pseudomonadota bacterium]